MPAGAEKEASRERRAARLGAVLSELDLHGPASRTELAAATGIARAVLSSLTAELVQLGLVRVVEDAARSEGARGRPQERLQIDGGRLALLAVHCTRARIRVLAIDLAGRPLLELDHEQRIVRGDASAMVDVLVRQLRAAAVSVRRAGAELLEVAIVLPAPVERATQRIHEAIDLGWRDIDLPAVIGERVRLPPLGIRIVNDANAAAYSEFRALRAARPATSDLVYMQSEIGIGGGLILDGALYTGATGTAFEPGHTVIVPNGEPCPCGQYGCLATVAGPERVLAEAGLLDVAETRGTAAALDELVRRYRAEEPDAVAAFDRAAAWLRMALAQIIATVRPQYVVLGGYLAKFRDELSVLSPLLLRGLGLGSVRGRDAILGAVNREDAALDGALQLMRAGLLATPAQLIGRARQAVRA